VSEGIRTNARIDRLNKRSNKPAPGSVVMGFLPMLANGNVSGSASLAAIESATGQGEPSEFDIWIEGTFGLLHQASSNGRFALVSLGADYLVSPDILVGLSLRIDTISQVQDAGGTSGGTGWMAGPYLTARLTDNLYLDLDAMAGTADNHVSPFGTYTDDFSSYRWQLGAALQGHWEHGPWAFEPAVRFAYFEEVTDAYTDTPGAVVPSTRNGVAQLSFGPGVAYRFVMADHLDVTTNLKLAGTLDIGTAQPSADTFHARLEGGFGFALPGGAHAQVSSAHAGIGAKTASTSLSLKVSSGF
jgi:outer membrane autotransporter protein